MWTGFHKFPLYCIMLCRLSSPRHCLGDAVDSLAVSLSAFILLKVFFRTFLGLLLSAILGIIPNVFNLALAGVCSEVLGCRIHNL